MTNLSSGGSEFVEALNLRVPYHVGMVVRDLDAAIETYRGAFGITEWRVRETVGFRQPSIWRGEPMDDPHVRLAYSAGGFPAIELVQPLDDVEWSASLHLREHGEGVYHLGYWVDDIRGAIARAADAGIEAEMLSLAEPPDGGPTTGFAYLSPSGARGLRIELVSSAGRERTLEWLRSGDEG